METTLTLQTEETQLNALKKASTDIALQCAAIEITDETTLAVAESILRRANDKAKEIDKMRSYLKDPYFQAGKKIDAIAKELSTPLEDAVKVGKTKIVAYDIEKNRIAFIEQQRINNIRAFIQSYAKEAVQCFDNCLTDPMMIAANDKYVVNFPSDDKFAEFLSEAMEMRRNLHDYAKARRIEINTPKDADSEITMEVKNIVVAQVEEIGTAQLIDAAPEKTRGMTGTWKFKVTNHNIIPANFLCVNEAAIKSFMKDNKDLLGKGASIAGIEFIFEPSVTFR